MQHRLFPRILARFVRVHPWGWYRHIAMRVEFYGCSQGMGIVINYFFYIDDSRLCFIFCPMKMSWTHRVFPSYVVYFLSLISSFVVVLTRIG